MSGTVLLYTLCSIGSTLSGKSEKYVWDHIINNKLFNYYVFIETSNEINTLEKTFLLLSILNIMV